MISIERDKNDFYWKTEIKIIEDSLYILWTKDSIFLFFFIPGEKIGFSHSLSYSFTERERNKEKKNKTKQKKWDFSLFSNGSFSEFCGQEDKVEPGTCASLHTELWDLFSSSRLPSHDLAPQALFLTLWLKRQTFSHIFGYLFHV